MSSHHYMVQLECLKEEIAEKSAPYEEEQQMTPKECTVSMKTEFSDKHNVEINSLFII